MTDALQKECKLCYNLSKILWEWGQTADMEHQEFQFFGGRASERGSWDWELLANGLPLQDYRPGQLIYLQGSQATHFYYISSGRIKSYLTSQDGAERILTVYRQGEILGEASFFDGQPRVSSATALTKCRIAAIDREHCDRTLRQNPQLSMSMIRYLAMTVRQLSTHVDDTAFLRADQRIARLLLALAEEDGVTVHCTHEFLGGAAGVSRVTVSRVLGQFQKCGMIHLGYGSIRLLEPKALERLF